MWEGHLQVVFWMASAGSDYPKPFLQGLELQDDIPNVVSRSVNIPCWSLSQLISTHPNSSVPPKARQETDQSPNFGTLWTPKPWRQGWFSTRILQPRSLSFWDPNFPWINLVDLNITKPKWSVMLGFSQIHAIPFIPWNTMTHRQCLGNSPSRTDWWYTYTSEKYEPVGAMIPNIWKVIKFHGSKPPTRESSGNIIGNIPSHVRCSKVGEVTTTLPPPAESQLPRFIDEAREAQFRLQGRAAAVVLEGGKVYPVK